MPQMPGGGRTGREKKRAVRKGLPVPVMGKKAGSPRPIAAGIKTASKLVTKKASKAAQVYASAKPAVKKPSVRKLKAKRG